MRGAPPPSQARDRTHYGEAALARRRAALGANGILAIWSENPDLAFERKLDQAGFTVRRQRPGRGGLRRAIYVERAEPPR